MFALNYELMAGCFRKMVKSCVKLNWIVYQIMIVVEYIHVTLTIAVTILILSVTVTACSP